MKKLVAHAQLEMIRRQSKVFEFNEPLFPPYPEARQIAEQSGFVELDRVLSSEGGEELYEDMKSRHADKVFWKEITNVTLRVLGNGEGT